MLRVPLRRPLQHMSAPEDSGSAGFRRTLLDESGEDRDPAQPPVGVGVGADGSAIGIDNDCSGAR